MPLGLAVAYSTVVVQVPSHTVRPAVGDWFTLAVFSLCWVFAAGLACFVVIVLGNSFLDQVVDVCCS